MNKCPTCNQDTKENLIQSNEDPNRYICFNCKQKELQDHYNKMIKLRQQDYKDLARKYIILNQGGN